MQRSSAGFLTLLLATLIVTVASPPAHALCHQRLQDIVSQALPKAIVQVPACIYREQVTIAKPLTLIAQPGAEIRGSDIWTQWTKSGALWVSVRRVPRLDTFRDDPSQRCRTGSNGRCFQAEQVFLNGRPLTQVSSSSVPGVGQFKVTANLRKIVLADKPVGHRVEVTTREHWIVGAADNVTVKGFRMRHAGNDAQRGALWLNNHANWRVEANVLSDTHGAVVALGSGNNNKLVGNDIFRGGQIGVVGAANVGTVVRDNLIHDNNTEGFNAQWEAGGLKFALVRGALIEGNAVYRNDGSGLWCDISCENATFRNNRVHHNRNAGIFFEISDGARIYGNAVWENGWCFSDWGWGAGILIASSRNADVHDNVVAWNADGISVLSQLRAQIDQRDANPDDDPPDLRHPWNKAVGNFIHDNVIAMTDDDPFDPDNDNMFALAWLQDWPGVLFQSRSLNRGAGNRYWYPNTEGKTRFAWSTGIADTQRYLREFNATPGEEAGVYMTALQKSTALSAARVPLAPQPDARACR
jgi:parallel beta-helix repeat protein